MNVVGILQMLILLVILVLSDVERSEVMRLKVFFLWNSLFFILTVFIFFSPTYTHPRD